ncbi:MAG: DNA mismatch repair protein MutS [Marinilabiliales bacterium]|nr:MAG: DNA mismatch repair protein MutS [Marinilabiliales bacterium]
MSIDKISEIYKNRILRFTKEMKKIKTNLIWMSILRFVFFILFLVTLVFLIKEFNWIKLSSLLAFISIFIFLVVYYIKKTELLNHIKNLIRINDDEIKAIDHEYSIFNSGDHYQNRDHEYSYDLDLFGEGSLFQYLNRTVTIIGSDFLANRLIDTKNSNKDSIINTQKSISEISKKIDWRQHFMAIGYARAATKEDNKNIDKWLNKSVYYVNKNFYWAIVILLPIITLMFLGLFLFGISHYSWFVTLALSQLFFASLQLRRTNREQAMVSEEMRILKIYSKLISHIENEEFKTENFKNLQKELETDQIKAQIAIKKLIKIIDAFDTRLNIFLGVILNGILMWDLLSVMRLERWKIIYGKSIEKWIKIIAEFDFYNCAGNYYFNNPDYIFPEINEDTILNTEELGHQLIFKEKRVNNNFKVQKAGEIDIITGANMAGKSTFLRTVGVNLILALNGFPVCASKFKFQILELFTGMRTADSLKENESYFYAELKRLKHIIEKLKKGKLTFLLLDEILKGTNSIDKAKGSWKFVENLIELKATGIVATHDLSLCKMENEYPHHIMNKCFEVEIDHNNIEFDYKLRSGITKNMNASLLMQQMGIFSN